MRHAVIMAGGAGTRLWPLSRRQRPKQLLRLFEGKSLLRHSFERLRPVLPAERIHVITLAEHADVIAAELPEMPRANLIGEPVGRDTANAVCLANAILSRRDPDAVVGMFTADQIIRPVDVFARVVDLGYRTAEQNPGALVTFGIQPTMPHTGLGYVHRGERAAEGVSYVRAFKEKPDLETARQYLASGEYFWNSGMFVWQARTLLDEICRHLPESHEKLSRVAWDWPSDQSTQLAAQVYPSLQKISFDYAVMEKARQVMVVEMPCEWIDVGSFPTIASMHPPDGAGNTSAGGATFRGIDAAGNIAISEQDHLIAAIGVEGLVIVHTPDATLVCRKEDAERVRGMAERLRDEFGGRYA